MSKFQDGDFQDRVRRQTVSDNKAVTTDPHLEADIAWLESCKYDAERYREEKLLWKTAVNHNARIDRFIARVKGEGWQPLSTAPQDGTRVDLKSGNLIALGCYWVEDVGWSQSGYYMWIWAPKDLKPTHWRLAQ